MNIPGLGRCPRLRYWWVNQNQTYWHDVAGGYQWSPKRKAKGHLNRFYETSRSA